MLYGHDFFLFVCEQVIDLLNMTVGNFLDLVLQLFYLILGDMSVLVFASFLDLIIDLSADVPDGDPRVLGELFRMLDDLLSALLRKRWYGESDDLSVVRGG